MGFFSYFGTVIIVSLFWSLLITTTLHFMPDAERNVIVKFEETELIKVNTGEISGEFESNLQDVKSFGIVDLAALSLYSGNLLLDLAGNFFFAIPEMFSLLFFGVFSLLRVSDFIQLQTLIWIQALFSIVATMVLIKFILGVRSLSTGGAV